MSDELFARLREHYSEAELVELAAIVALENFRSRFNRVFRVEAHGIYCPLPRPSGVPADKSSAATGMPRAQQGAAGAPKVSAR